MWQGTSGEWTDNTGSMSVCGVMHFRFNRRRILPRTPADLTPP